MVGTGLEIILPAFDMLTQFRKKTCSIHVKT